MCSHQQRPTMLGVCTPMSQNCQIITTSPMTGNNPNTPCHPAKSSDFVGGGADGGELLLLELAFQILKIDQLFAHKRNLV